MLTAEELAVPMQVVEKQEQLVLAAAPLYALVVRA